MSTQPDATFHASGEMEPDGQLVLTFAPRPCEAQPSEGGGLDTGSEERLLEQALRILERRFTRTGHALDTPALSAEYFRMKLAHLSQEVFAVAYLDHHHRVLAVEVLFSGTIDQCVVHPREVVRRALGHNASAVLFAHNHPSGQPEPSAADRTLTGRLKEALALVEIRVLDHFVIGGTRWVSFADRHWL